MQHAAAVGGEETREVDAVRTLIREAARAAASSLGAEREPNSATDGSPARLDREAATIRRLAEHMEEAGALHLAAETVRALASSGDALSVAEHGRALAQVARITWKLGDLDRARVMYRRVARLGKAYGEPELRARAWIGYVAIAQLEGDHDAMRRWARAAARVADRLGIRQLQRLAHSGLMIGAAKARRFDAALIHGWIVYELSLDDPNATSEVLANMGQLLLDAGQPEASRAAFATVLSRPQPARIGLPALGGLALAGAQLRDHAIVEWAAAETRREARGVHQPLQVASALVECSSALATVGAIDSSDACRSEALAIAVRQGYHDLIIRLREGGLPGALGANREPAALTVRALRVAHELKSLAPARLPEHVSLVAA